MKSEAQNTVVIMPTGTLGKLTPDTDVGERLGSVKKDAAQIAQAIEDGKDRFGDFTTLLLPPLWFDAETESGTAATIALSQDLFKGIVETVCARLRDQGFGYVVMTARDRSVAEAARAVETRLNHGEEKPWVGVYDPTAPSNLNDPIAAIIAFLVELLRLQ